MKRASEFFQNRYFGGVNAFTKDQFDNYYIVVGDKPTTMFTCHLDTACSTQSDVKHVFDGNYIKTDGTTVLSADDKAGMTGILYMIKKM